MDELIGDHWTDHNSPPSAAPGREGLKQMMTEMTSAFPDIHVIVDQLVAEADLVVGRMTTTGTNQGEFMGMQPTGKRMTMTEFHMIRIENGRAVEHWGNSDDLGMMQQLGVIPKS